MCYGPRILTFIFRPPSEGRNGVLLILTKIRFCVWFSDRNPRQHSTPKKYVWKLEVTSFFLVQKSLESVQGAPRTNR